ncbi:alpha-glucosidase [Clostridium acetobutylicum]|nr:alpha-glucosidase [Clostridium acetobutylicum]
MYSGKKKVWKKTLYYFVAAALTLNTVPEIIRPVSAKAAPNMKTISKVKTVKQNASVSNLSAKLNDDTLQIVNGLDETDIKICEPQVLKVDYKPSGQSSSDTLVVDPNKTWNTGNIISSDLNSDPMVITTQKMTIKISKSDLTMSVYDSTGKQIVKQQSIASKSVSFTHNSGDRFYGINGYNFKEDSSKGMLRNGTESVYAGYQGHCGSPFVWSNDGYGLLVDSDGGSFTIGDTSLQYSGISKTDTDYYLMLGSPKEVISEESDVSGKAPMFPKWATGFTNTQWGWNNSLSGTGNDEDKLKSVLNTYRSKQIPIDNFCLDFDWKKWGQDNYGEFKWNTDNFPDSENGQLKAYMDSKGLKMTGIMKPRILADSEQARYVTSKGWWLPGDSAASDYCSGKMMENVNFAISDVRKWWWNNIQDAFDKGIVGFWNDECDENVNFGNFGNMNMERAIYDGQRAYKNQRVWSLNRNYYAGAQRYSYGMWSGDISTGFDSMANQRERMLSAVNLGEAKWGMDTGGFNDGDPTPENYARWMEFSAFTPIFRVHGQDNRVRYPWAFGSTAEAAAKKAMQLRYTLIPYIYSYDRSASQSGLGLVRSLMMEYPNDSNAANDKEAWMFGDYMLVSPVVNQGQTSKSIYLPEGNWIDYTTGREYTGGQTINYAVDSTNWSDIPIFIKSGAIIPTQDFENYVGEKKITDVYVDAFPSDKATTFDYYDDDGTSYDYENGSYFDQKMTLQTSTDSKSVQFNIDKNTGSYTPDLKDYIVKMHVKGNGAVTANGQALTQYSSYDALKSASGEGYALGTDTYGNVVYIKVSSGDAKNINVSCNPLPVTITAAANPKGGTYYGPQTVSLTASKSDATIYYTLDGTTPTVNSTKYIAPITLNPSSSKQQLNFLAVDASGNQSQIYTEVYNVLKVGDGIKVHFKDPNGWSAPNIYYYDPAGKLTGPGWPGVKMNSDGNGWYSYTIQNWTSAKVLFDDGTNQIPGVNQPGIDVTGEEWYENGKLYQANPDISASASVKGGNYNTAQTVTLTSSNSDATIYYTLDGTTPTVNSAKYTAPITINSTTTLKFIAVGSQGNQSDVYTEVYNINTVGNIITVHFKNPSGWGEPYVYYYTSSGQTGPGWPGVKMNSDGNGWYSYTINGLSSAKVLFNDKINQTPGRNQPGYDVTGEEWYENGTWYKSNPDVESIAKAALKINSKTVNNANSLCDAATINLLPPCLR